MVPSSQVKHLGINLTKYVQDLCPENYKILIKEVRDDLNKWRHTVFLDWKTQYSKEVSSSQISLWI